MKNLKITTKITLWYAAFFIAFSLLVVIAAFEVQDYVEGNNAKILLSETVADLIDSIEDDGEAFVLNRRIKYLDDGVYLSVYNEGDTLIIGKRPSAIPRFPEFKSNTVTTFRDEGGDKWYIYDKTAVTESDELRVRGVVKGIASLNLLTSNVRVLMFLLCGALLIALMGGYIVTKRAFGPVRNIIATVQSIERDADISRRIHVAKNSDEIDKVASTINEMLDVVEKTVENEKRFTSNVSHELRTPLAVIISQSEYAIEDKTYTKQALDTINREAKRMSEMVNRLLFLSRSDSGRQHLQFEEVNLSELCEIIGEQQELLAEETGNKILTEIEPDIQVRADEAMLTRVILNLMDNARKYASGSDIKLSLHQNKQQAVITIDDNGPGIPDEYKERVWDRFFRIDQENRAGDSSGLGLSIVKALVKEHQGEVLLEDNPCGKGCRFTVILPLKPKNNNEYR